MDYVNNKVTDIDAIPGERWFPKESSFEDDITEYWGDWGVCSEVDTLKAVLLRRPGKEIEDFNASEVRFSDEPIDVEFLPQKQNEKSWLRYTGISVPRFIMLKTSVKTDLTLFSAVTSCL